MNTNIKEEQLETANEYKNSSPRKDWRQSEIGVLWKRESKTSGKKYLGGELTIVDDMGSSRRIYVTIMANNYKDNPNKPDYYIYSDGDVPAEKLKERKDKMATNSKKDSVELSG